MKSPSRLMLTLLVLVTICACAAGSTQLYVPGISNDLNKATLHLKRAGAFRGKWRSDIVLDAGESISKESGLHTVPHPVTHSGEAVGWLGYFALLGPKSELPGYGDFAEFEGNLSVRISAFLGFVDCRKGATDEQFQCGIGIPQSSLTPVQVVGSIKSGDVLSWERSPGTLKLGVVLGYDALRLRYYVDDMEIEAGKTYYMLYNHNGRFQISETPIFEVGN